MEVCRKPTSAEGRRRWVKKQWWGLQRRMEGAKAKKDAQAKPPAVAGLAQMGQKWAEEKATGAMEAAEGRDGLHPGARGPTNRVGGAKRWLGRARDAQRSPGTSSGTRNSGRHGGGRVVERAHAVQLKRTPVSRRSATHGGANLQIATPTWWAPGGQRMRPHEGAAQRFI